MKSSFSEKLLSSGLSWLWLTVAALVSDQFSKHIILNTMHIGQFTRITANFNIRLVNNPGAAFSILAGGEQWQFLVLISINLIMLFVLVRWMLRSSIDDYWHNAGVALILAGAIGNLIDRIQFGAVIDFIDLHFRGHHWPTFNIADAAICLGVFILLFLGNKLDNQS